MGKPPKWHNTWSFLRWLRRQYPRLTYRLEGNAIHLNLNDNPLFPKRYKITPGVRP